MKRIAENIVLLPLIGVFIAVLLSNSACTKIDTPPMLEIRVENAEGQRLEGIIVGLFESLDEWSMLENPVQAWKETDWQGKALFVDLKEIKYYFYADGDSVSNVGGRVQLDEALKINEKKQITVVVE